MMGKSHAMSASAVAFSLAALGVGPVSADVQPLSVVFLYTAVVVGGSLWPDWDSNSSTVVRSFGIFGKLVHEIVDFIGLLIYNMTRTKYDKKRSNGHRTFFHTTAAAIMTGIVISVLSLIGGTVELFEKQFAIGQLFSLFFMWIFLHVGLAGLFEKQVKKARKAFGPYVMMLASLLMTIGVSIFLPENTHYGWLGAAAVLGILIHNLGDMITKMGIPMLWPIRLGGKAWYDISLPSFMRITAGGEFEKKVLFPIFCLVTIVSAVLCLPEFSDIVDQIRVSTGIQD